LFVALDTTEPLKANGLKTAIDTVIAPSEAFQSIRLVPTWGWAAIIASALMIAGYVMQLPAAHHAAIGTTQHMVATSPFFAGMTDAQKQKVIAQSANPPAYQTVIGIIGTIVTLFIAAVLNAFFLYLGNAAGRGTAGFSRYWAGSMNVAIPSFGLSYVVLGCIAIALGPDHFATSADLFRAIPGLGMILRPAGLFGGFLTAINVFTVWGLVLNVLLMRLTGEVRGAMAWIVPVLIFLGGALLQGFFVRLAGG
jgi:hypothetical protein